MTLLDHVQHAESRLIRAGIPPRDARLDARVLARHALGWDAATWLVHEAEIGPIHFKEQYDALIRRREHREPLFYITGCREFWGLDFEVSRGALIPRPETEFIIEEVLAMFRPSGQARRRTDQPEPTCVIDVGTGSGVLAVALAREFPAANIIATDISPEALEVARQNARRHGVIDRLTFAETSFLEGLDVRADLIVSNPPYIPSVSAPGLQPEVREYEPTVALMGGPDGLDAIRALLAQADTHLSENGLLVFEFGFGQEDGTRDLISQFPSFSILTYRSDLQGIPRVAVLRWQSSPGVTLNQEA